MGRRSRWRGMPFWPGRFFHQISPCSLDLLIRGEVAGRCHTGRTHLEGERPIHSHSRHRQALPSRLHASWIVPASVRGYGDDLLIWEAPHLLLDTLSCSRWSSSSDGCPVVPLKRPQIAEYVDQSACSSHTDILHIFAPLASSLGSTFFWTACPTAIGPLHRMMFLHHIEASSDR